MSRAKTAKELRDEFLEHCRAAADYWASPNITPGTSCDDRLSGLLHSILTLIDGCAGLPSFDLVARPHPDDKAYHQENGENWIEPGTVINESDYLHELLYRGRWARAI